MFDRPSYVSQVPKKESIVINPQDHSNFTCNLCYEEINPRQAPSLLNKPPVSFRFDCGDQFCTQCIKDSFKFHIERAEIDQLKCPQQGCNTLVS